MARMTFEEAALLEFPDLQDVITRPQVKHIREKHGFGCPTHIVNPQNTITRGIYKFAANLPVNSTVTPAPVESDEELETRITETYETMDVLIKAVSANSVNSLIISGAAGLGKSYETNAILHEVNNGEYGYVFHRGYLKATGIFKLLWENRLPGQTIVIDDCDAIFRDEIALNILKAALELKDTRIVSWGSEKEFIDQDGDVIPRHFEYRGNIIFLTNLNISDMASGSSKDAPHLAALESRSLVLDLKIRTKREIMTKIRLTVKQGMLRKMGLNNEAEYLILNFVDKYKDQFKDLNLRTIEKLAILFKLNPATWENMGKSLMIK